MLSHLFEEFNPFDVSIPFVHEKSRALPFVLSLSFSYSEVAGIAPLLDVEDMVMMQRPDWKCVFTYVQSIYRRFKDED